MTTRRQILGGSLALAAVTPARAQGQFTQSGLVGKLEGPTLATTMPARFQEAPQLAEQAAAIGVWSVLRKPFDLENVIRVVRAALRSSSLGSQGGGGG